MTNFCLMISIALTFPELSRPTTMTFTWRRPTPSICDSVEKNPIAPEILYVHSSNCSERNTKPANDAG